VQDRGDGAVVDRHDADVAADDAADVFDADDRHRPRGRLRRIADVQQRPDGPAHVHGGVGLGVVVQVGGEVEDTAGVDVAVAEGTPVLAGYYAWQSRAASARAIRHVWLTDQIHQVHALSNGTYGGDARLRI
jgi:hypothetical protein